MENKIRNKWQRERFSFTTTGTSKVQQSFKNKTDINLIMKKYEKTGLLDYVMDPSKANYGDFSEVTDYQSALNQVMEAQEAFMTLPASTRKRFDNDPAKFVAFMDDPKNTDEAIKLGLAKKGVNHDPNPSNDPPERSGGQGAEAPDTGGSGGSQD